MKGDEECDPSPDFDETSGCDFDCTFAVCGDGHINSVGEVCDDGNYVGGDGCDATCDTIELGYSCSSPPTE